MKKIERRQNFRISVTYVTVEVYATEDCHTNPEMEDICTIRNLSETGLLFSGDQQYNCGQTLRVTFIIPESMVIIRTKVIVVHVERTKKNYTVGAKFSNLESSDRQLIKHFIDKKIEYSLAPILPSQ